jgi:hypothetical protein
MSASRLRFEDPEARAARPAVEEMPLGFNNLREAWRLPRPRFRSPYRGRHGGTMDGLIRIRAFTSTLNRGTLFLLSLSFSGQQGSCLFGGPSLEHKAGKAPKRPKENSGFDNELQAVADLEVGIP